MKVVVAPRRDGQGYGSRAWTDPRTLARGTLLEGRHDRIDADRAGDESSTGEGAKIACVVWNRSAVRIAVWMSQVLVNLMSHAE